MAKAIGITFPVQMAFGRPEAVADEFRDVPRSDRGDGYSDRGQLGSYATNGGRPWPLPESIRVFTGYGGDEADIRRGHVEPAIRESPAYDKANYTERWSDPKLPDEDQGNRDVMDRDWEFRMRNRRSKGFLTRSRFDTERG